MNTYLFSSIFSFLEHFPTPVLWYCAISIVFFICYLLYKAPSFFRKVKKVGKALAGTQFKKNSTLNDQELKAVATSAIYSAQQGAYVNALETGLSKGDITEILGSWWGISNQSDAVSTLEYLQHGGYQQTFPYIIAALDQTETSPSQFFEENVQDLEIVDKLTEQAHNLKACLGELKADKVISSGQDLKKIGVAGWDSGRLSFITRLCHDIGYINEDAAWSYINAAHQMAKQNFTNWEDFGKSYVIGRAMWGGAGSGNSGIAAIAEELLEKKPSPFEGGLS